MIVVQTPKAPKVPQYEPKTISITFETEQEERTFRKIMAHSISIPKMLLEHELIPEADTEAVMNTCFMTLDRMRYES